MNQTHPIRVLLVDDDELDIELTLDAFKNGKLLVHVDVVHNGVEALDYVYKKNQYENKETPNVILLDINMPKKNGIEVVKELKSHETYKIIPIIMMTSSKNEKDILDSYKYHANCYIEKPIEQEEFLKVIRGFENFWLSVVQIPKFS